MTAKDIHNHDDAILTDLNSKSNKKIAYLKVRDGEDTVEIKTSNISQWNPLLYFSSIIKDIFLPKGYPDSVSSDYLEYQIWDTCQAFCSSISGTLTMRAIMQGIGVGSEAATPLSAAITWIMKDGTGMIGSILFAWTKGSKLDSECKKWRLFADVLNDIAMFMELYIPFVINYSMQLLCIATVFKALVGTAGGSTRAALITHQAIKGNIADVSAKDGSQEIFVNLFAFIFGVLLLNNVTETDQIWTVMYTTTIFHLIFNYKAVKCLKMNVFNCERFCLSLRIYLPTSNVPTVEQINRRESVFLLAGLSDKSLCGFSIKFGVCIKKVIKRQKISSLYLTTLTTLFKEKNYFIIPNVKSHELYVTFRNTFHEVDVLKAYFHASILAISLTYLQGEKTLEVLSRSRKNSPIYRLTNILKESSSSGSDTNINRTCMTWTLQAFMTCEDFIDKEFTAYCKACEDQGWNINKHLINIDDWRADWIYVKEVKTEGKTAVKFNKNNRSNKVPRPKNLPAKPNDLQNFLIIS